MITYILDASTVLNFLMKPEYPATKEFAKIIRDAEDNKVELFSTNLLPLEVGNGLRYAFENENLAKEPLEAFLNLRISYISLNNTQYSETLRLSYQLKSTFYDTSYHILALFLKGVFLTSDEKYFNKAKELGSIKLLKFS